MLLEEGSLEQALLSPEDRDEQIADASIGGDEESCANAGNVSNGDNENDDENENVGKKIFSLAIPALAALAIDPLMTLADTVFVGRTATTPDALAGVGSAAALLTFSFYLFNFLCVVTTPLVSQRRASGDGESAITLGGQALSLAILLGSLLSLFLIAFSQPLLDVMGTGNAGAGANGFATSFLTIRAIAAPAYFLISASTGILRGYLDTKTAFTILLFANIINLSLDVVLISLLDMGPTGAAIATTTAEWVSAASFLAILAGKVPSVDGLLGSNQQRQVLVTSDGIVEEEEEETSRSLTRDEEGDLIVITPTLEIPTWENIKPLVIASSSAFVRSFMLQLSIAGAAAMAARTGDASEMTASASASIAAHQIALQLWLLGSFVCDALAAASQTLVADGIGREDSRGVRDVSKIVFAYSLGLGVVLSSALAIGDYSGFLVNLFTSDKATQEALIPLLTILIAAQPLNALVFSADGILQGASQFGFQAKSMILSSSVAIMSFVGLEYFTVDNTSTLQHIWYGLIILQLMRGLTSLWKLSDKEGPIDLFERS
uniref:Protein DETOXIFICATION n=1 Tax=Chaetoceros debilis TaxID=122233 RepID=A0A7S3Q054_9STRA